MATGSVCKNHPGRKTARRCFQCKAPICHPCTLHRDRHYFCGPACHEAWLTDPAPKRQSKKQRVKARRRLAKRRALAEHPLETAAAASEAPAVAPAPPGLVPPAAPVEESASTETGALKDQTARLPETQEGAPSADVPEPSQEELQPEASAPDVEDEGPEVTAEDLHDIAPFAAAPAPDAPPAPPPEAPFSGTPVEAALERVRPREPIVIRQAAEPAGRWRWGLLAALHAALLVLLGILLLRESPPADGTRLAHALPNASLPAQAPLPPPALDAALPLETTAATLVVYGAAPGAVTVTVMINGREFGAHVRPEGAFRTEPVPLDPGLNAVQVRARSAAHPFPAYSRAHLVRRLERPAPAARPARLAVAPPDITRGDPGRPAVSFTFDGGSEANAAREIFAVLREHGVTTTLFLTGEFIRKYPDLVRQAHADGHEIGNHTWNHPHLTTFNANSRHDLLPQVTEAFFKKQLADTEAAYQAVTGKPMAPFWRAPYGEVNAQLQAWAAELGYRHVGWTRRVGSVSTLDSLDWVNDQDSHLYLSGTELKTRFVGLVENEAEAVRGGIFLMHLGTQRKTDMIHWQLGEILAAYKSAGFAIVPVSQLVEPRQSSTHR